MRNIKNKLKNNFVTAILTGAGIIYANPVNSQENKFVKIDTLEYNYAEYKVNLFERETQEIIALDINNNKISDQVIKKTLIKKFLGKKSLQIERWINYNDKENQKFDRYELMRKEFNLFGKEKYSETTFSEDILEINKLYALPKFKIIFR